MAKRVSRNLILLTLYLAICLSAQDDSRDNAIVFQEHFALRDGLRIYLWEKRVEDFGENFSETDKVALLVHGATWSGRPDFDLQVRDYSLMDYMAGRGYDVFAIDVHGYGRSDKTEADWSPASTAALDIDAAVDYIRELRGVDQVSILGWSWGCQTAGLFAMQHPEKVKKLILYAPTWKPNPERAAEIPFPAEQYRVNTPEAAASDFIEGCYEQDVVDAYVRACLETDPRSPNGVIVDFLTRLPILDPARIAVPVMIFFGEHEFPEKAEQMMEFFKTLKTTDKQLIVLPGGGHAIILEKPHLQAFHIFTAFFDRP
jgi:pimeloyl-ACP methyl ester carboxylesterase